MQTKVSAVLLCKNKICKRIILWQLSGIQTIFPEQSQGFAAMLALWDTLVAGKECLSCKQKPRRTSHTFSWIVQPYQLRNLDKNLNQLISKVCATDKIFAKCKIISGFKRYNRDQQCNRAFLDKAIMIVSERWEARESLMIPNYETLKAASASNSKRVKSKAAKIQSLVTMEGTVTKKR